MAAFEEVIPRIAVRPSDVAAPRLDANAVAELALHKAVEARLGLYRDDPRKPDVLLARDVLPMVARHGQARLLAGPDFLERVASDLWRELFGQADRTEAGVAEVHRRLGDVAAAMGRGFGDVRSPEASLRNSGALERTVLDFVAIKFGVERPESESLPELQEMDAAHPDAWANARNGLGGVLRMQSERVGGEACAAPLAEAAQAYPAASCVFADAEYPWEWAWRRPALASFHGDGASTSPARRA